MCDFFIDCFRLIDLQLGNLHVCHQCISENIILGRLGLLELSRGRLRPRLSSNCRRIPRTIFLLCQTAMSLLLERYDKIFIFSAQLFFRRLRVFHEVGLVLCSIFSTPWLSFFHKTTVNNLIKRAAQLNCGCFSLATKVGSKFFLFRFSIS